MAVLICSKGFMWDAESKESIHQQSLSTDLDKFLKERCRPVVENPVIPIYVGGCYRGAQMHRWVSVWAV